MNCRDFETTILSMGRAQLLEASVRRQTLAHITQCPACADYLAEQQALTAAVRATAKSLRDEAASAHIEQSLRAAFRKQANAAAFAHSPGHARRWPKRALVAAAAILLLCLLAGIIRQWSFADRDPRTATVLPQPAPKKAKPPEPPSPTGPHERAAARHVAGKRRPTPPAVHHGATTGEEAVTQFITLVNETQLAPLESGQVLRVELPTSTLISMGLRITAEDPSKLVIADLLVGQDGLPRAIRFVRLAEANAGDLLEHSTNK